MVNEFSFLFIGALATILPIIISIIKLYSDNKASIRNHAQFEQRIKNEIFNNTSKIERLEKDVEKLENRLVNDQNNLLNKFSQMELRIEERFDKLQDTLIQILKGE